MIGWNGRQEVIKTHLWKVGAAILFLNQSPAALSQCGEQYPKNIKNKSIAHKRRPPDRLNQEETITDVNPPGRRQIFRGLEILN